MAAKRSRFRIKHLLWLLLLPLFYAINYAWKSFPIISGYGAKMMASAIYLQGRTPENVLREELGSFPLSLGSFEWNEKDSTVTGTVWGTAKRTALFRKTVGATLVNETTVEQLKAQQFYVAPPPLQPDTCYWPCGNNMLPADSLAQYAAMQQTIETLIKDTLRETPLRMRAVVVIHKGKLVAEK